MGLLSSLFDEDYIEKEVAVVPSVHEQEDGVILAVCATGTSSHDSILSWIRFLEKTNPRLGKDISVLFTLKSPLGPTDDLMPVTITDDTPPSDRFLSNSRDTEGSLVSGEITPESPSSSSPSLGLDPQNPDLTQIGVDPTSDTNFLNWPHHYNKDRRKSS